MLNVSDSGPAIECVEQREVYANDFVRLYDDLVRFPDGSPGTYVRLAATGDRPGVAVLVTQGHRVALVRTYRYPIGEWEWGVPRGMGAGSTPEESARLELAEELGISSPSLEQLGTVHPDSGSQTTRVHVFHTVWPGELAPADPNEVHEAAWVPALELADLVARGRIRDGFTLSALALAWSRGLLPLN